MVKFAEPNWPNVGFLPKSDIPIGISGVAGYVNAFILYIEDVGMKLFGPEL